MKLFSIKNSFIFSLLLSLIGCATYKKQISTTLQNWEQQSKTTAKVAHNIYLIGDAGNSPDGNQTLDNLKNELSKEGANTTVLFLGDNVYPKGINPKKGKAQKKGIQKLNAQLNTVTNFKGKTIFIPGNHDWYNGLKGLKKQEKLVEKALQKNTFLPENGYPLEVVHLTKDIDVIIVDSQWYITDWNKHPKINDKCDEIKTREKFFVELEGLINKSQDKITLLAIHHPMVSNGTHGGASSFKQHIFPFSDKIPLPIIGSVFQTLRKTSGLNPQDIQATRYNELTKRISTLAQEHNRIVFVSGHDHSLQYLFKNGIPQIVSGAGSKKSVTHLGKDKGFTYGTNGYVKLSVLEDESLIADFKSNNQTVFKTTVFKSPQKTKHSKYNLSNLKAQKKAQIYPDSQTKKSKIYQTFWGPHYRNAYSTPITAPTVLLDTLYGGLSVVKKGGGHQSKSLRLKDKNGKQYVMRALKKSAVRFLQTVAFKKDYITDKVKGSYTEDLLHDFYTSAHPYTPFIIGELSDPIGVLHTNPKLFYVPKQDLLIPFDNEFGDALYMVEERPEKHHSDLASFDFPDDIISTDDLFKSLRKNKKNKLDEQNYVTARLFDMIIGDWDRHVDQWRWAVYKKGKQKTFKPIPRDRDQAFSNYDGILLTSLTSMVDAIKLMQTYDKDIRNLFKFNDEPYPIDVSLLQESSFDLWNQQADYIKKNLTDKIIDTAFDQLPKAVQNSKTEAIKKVLKYRRDHVDEIAKAYRKILEKFVIVKGTDKKDKFEISSNKQTTTINVYRLKKEKKDKLYFSKKFNNKNTKEIWVYGLDDDDEFIVLNNTSKSPKIRLIGGQNNDVYHIAKDAKKIKIHDFKHQKNTFNGASKKYLSELYDNNTYQYRKVKDHTHNFFPLLGYNPDDGLALGGTFNRTNYGYNRQPFTNKHDLKVKYFTATYGFDITHNSEFATYKNHWNIFVATRFTSSNFSNNFFGFGNNTQNNDDDLGFNYNRVKTEIREIKPGLVWNNLKGASFKISVPFKRYEIEETNNRFLNDNSDFINFNSQHFTGINTHFEYQHFNNVALPSLGFVFSLASGWDYNISKKSSLYYLKPVLGIVQPLSLDKKWVLASKIRSQFNLGSPDFQIYQAAFIGGNNGLRGFRNERFAGKRSYSQNTDIRYTIGEKNTALLPITYGFSLGYDYGRVWYGNEDSNPWHHSYGTGVWVSLTGLAKMNLTLFNSKESTRLGFGVGVNW